MGYRVSASVICCKEAPSREVLNGRFVLITRSRHFLLVDGNFRPRVFLSLVLPDDPKSRFSLFGLGPASDFYNGLSKTRAYYRREGSISVLNQNGLEVDIFGIEFGHGR